MMAGLREFVVQFGAEEQCIEHLAGLRWPGGFACAGCGGRQAWRLKARPRVYGCGLPPTGIGDRWNGTSPDTNRSDQVVSRRLSDGPRQARRLGQVSAARPLRRDLQASPPTADHPDRRLTMAPRIDMKTNHAELPSRVRTSGRTA